MRHDLAVAAALLVVLAASASAQVVKIRCRDGGADVVEAFGRRVKKFGLCDLDRTCVHFMHLART
jgi:hypothetical protein